MLILAQGKALPGMGILLLIVIPVCGIIACINSIQAIKRLTENKPSEAKFAGIRAVGFTLLTLIGIWLLRGELNSLC